MVMKKYILFLSIILSLSSCNKSENHIDKPSKSIVFTVIGDVPYGSVQRKGFIKLIEKHNAQDASEFIVHIGDIKAGKDPCDKSVYQDVSSLLKQLTVPTFVVLGDNEYNDCDSPIQALDYWNTYFLHLNKNWTFSQQVNYQSERIENFSWIQNNVLFIGLNIVGSSVHDENEWQTRLTDDGNWVQQLLKKYKDDVKATVVFAHANMTENGKKKFKPFTDVFRVAAASFDKPILYLQGDEYLNNLRIKNNVNKSLHRKYPFFLKELEIHEIQPIKFNGSPFTLRNRMIIPKSQHIKFTSFWRRLRTNIEREF